MRDARALTCVGAAIIACCNDKTGAGGQMTLLIACILIHGFGLAWGWYVAAALLWIVEYVLDLWWSYAYENDKIPPWAER